MFPALANYPFEFHWYGRGALTSDMLPHLYEPEPGLIAGLGFNGRGIAMGTAFGVLLARRALGEPPSALPFPTSPLSAIPLGALRGAYVALRTVISQLRAG